MERRSLKKIKKSKSYKHLNADQNSKLWKVKRERQKWCGIALLCCCFPSLGDWCRKLAPLLDQSDLRLYPMATCPCTFSRASGSSLEFTLSFNGFRNIFLCSDWRLLWFWLYVPFNQNRIKLLSATDWGNGAIFSSKGKKKQPVILSSTSRKLEKTQPVKTSVCVFVFLSFYDTFFFLSMSGPTSQEGAC